VTDAVLVLAARLTVVAPSPSESASISSRATDDSIVRPGWLGFVVFLAMAVALFFLLRSFLKHLKRVNFEEEPDPTEVRFQGPPEPDADHETKP
jgi:protein-S-isoprenylcysteine O-methyltransferase Ste14